VTEVDVEANQAFAASLPFSLPADTAPADLAAELVAALPERDGEQYLLYERDGQWVLAIGALATIELDSDELRIIRDGIEPTEDDAYDRESLWFRKAEHGIRVGGHFEPLHINPSGRFKHPDLGRADCQSNRRADSAALGFACFRV